MTTSPNKKELTKKEEPVQIVQFTVENSNVYGLGEDGIPYRWIFKQNVWKKYGM